MYSNLSYFMFIALGYVSQITLLFFLVLITLSHFKPSLTQRLKTVIIIMLALTVIGSVVSLSRTGYMMWKLYSQQNHWQTGL